MTGTERILWAAAVVAGWLLLCFVCGRRRRAAVSAEHPASRATDDSDGRDRQSVLVAWASQSGTAEQLARHSAEILQRYFPVRLLPLSAVNEQVLLDTHCAFFVASTYGEGEPPDNGIAFQRQYLNAPGSFDLSHLEFAVLALGDRAYQRFCAFGRHLQTGLERLGARPLGPVTEADHHDRPATVRLPEGWWQQLTRVAPQLATCHSTDRTVASPTPRQKWLLTSRTVLNPGSAGAPLYRIVLTPAEDMPRWRAGDIVEINPRNSVEQCEHWLCAVGVDGSQKVTIDGVVRPLSAWLSERQLPTGPVLADFRNRLAESPQHWLTDLPLLPMREYSAASMPEEGALQLLVRLQRDERGEPGKGSGWLGQFAQIGDVITTRVRNNPSFHGPDPARPLILIGAGSGLAGLRAHLVERLPHGRSGPNWLVFGERSRGCDSLLDSELNNWLRSGHLVRLDRVFSRDRGASEPRYVQDVLDRQQADLRLWVTEGAAIYVCGSLKGMGLAVHASLEAILGSEVLAKLRATGRYRRDLY